MPILTLHLELSRLLPDRAALGDLARQPVDVGLVKDMKLAIALRKEKRRRLNHAPLLPVVPSKERRRHRHRDWLARCRNQLEGRRHGPRGVDLTLGKSALEVNGVHLAQTGRERVKVLEANLMTVLGLALEVLAEHVGVLEEALRLGGECLNCCIQ